MKRVYFHINNGGVSIGVDRCSIVIESMHFGNNQHAMRLDTDAEGLRLLGRLLLEQADSDPDPKGRDIAHGELREDVARKSINITSWDDFDSTKEGTANESRHGMASTRTTIVTQPGVIIWDWTSDTYWYGTVPTGFTKTNEEAVPRRAVWSPMQSDEVAIMIRRAILEFKE